MTILVLVVALLTADAPKPAAIDQDALKKFQGNWSLTRREHGGEPEPAKKLQTWRVEVNATKITVRDGDKVEEELEIVHLDPKGKPAAINLKVTQGDDKGKVIQGIWKADGVTLTLCIAEPGKDRPKQFAGKKETGHTVLVLAKAKK
jgi:uncharacterized protein (TIGR03067 family)